MRKRMEMGLLLMQMGRCLGVNGSIMSNMGLEYRFLLMDQKKKESIKMVKLFIDQSYLAISTLQNLST